MAHVADLELTGTDIGGLSSLDALAGFFTRLGHPTGRRKELPAASLDLTGESAATVGGKTIAATATRCHQ